MTQVSANGRAQKTKEPDPLDLALKYRPKRLSDVVGQQAAVKGLLDHLKANTLPHTLLFHGPRGT
jgi:DNA polymerase III gamma/tau subunit